MITTTHIPSPPRTVATLYRMDKPTVPGSGGCARSSEMETWKPIPLRGFEKHYSISSLGNVRRDLVVPGCRSGRILKPQINRDGYRIVGVSAKDKHITKKVARLVAVAFLGTPPSVTHQVNHKDGIKSNDCATNLEWATPSENLFHRCRVLGVGVGESVNTAKLNPRKVREIRQSSLSQNQLARKYGVRQSTIWSVLSEKSWKSVSTKPKPEPKR